VFDFFPLSECLNEESSIYIEAEMMKPLKNVHYAAVTSSKFWFTKYGEFKNFVFS